MLNECSQRFQMCLNFQQQTVLKSLNTSVNTIVIHKPDNNIKSDPAMLSNRSQNCRNCSDILKLSLSNHGRSCNADTSYLCLWFVSVNIHCLWPLLPLVSNFDHDREHARTQSAAGVRYVCCCLSDKWFIITGWICGSSSRHKADKKHLLTTSSTNVSCVFKPEDTSSLTPVTCSPSLSVTSPQCYRDICWVIVLCEVIYYTTTVFDLSVLMQ